MLGDFINPCFEPTMICMVDDKLNGDPLVGVHVANDGIWWGNGVNAKAQHDNETKVSKQVVETCILAQGEEPKGVDI